MDPFDYTLGQLQIYLMVVLRTAGILFVAPVFGAKRIPVQLKIWLSLLIALAVTPTVAHNMVILPAHLLAYTVLLIEEVLWGILIGFACLLLFMGVQFSGQIVGLQMGFGIVNVIDPQSSAQVSIIGQFQYLLAILIFLAIDGHHFLLGALASSFDLLPPGGLHFSGQIGEKLIRMATGIFLLAIKIGAPVMVALFLTSVAFGILARSVPQMNVFIIGFPLKIGVGLVMLAGSIPIFFYVLEKLIRSMEGEISQLIALFAA